MPDVHVELIEADANSTYRSAGAVGLARNDPATCAVLAFETFAFLGPLGRGGSSLRRFLLFSDFPSPSTGTDFPSLFRSSFSFACLGDCGVSVVPCSCLLPNWCPSSAFRPVGLRPGTFASNSPASSGSLIKFLVDLRVDGCEGGRESRSDQGNLLSDFADLNIASSEDG